MRRPSLLSHVRVEDAANRPAAGIWSLDGDRLASVESFDVGPAIVLVPSEQVLLTVAELPLPDARRRAAAAPFAIEDRIAAPLEAVHVAVGMEGAPGRYLVGAVDDAVMAGWVAQLVEAGLDRAALVPDALALPVPEPGGWSVDLAGMRAMVRGDDGAGFALPVEHLAAAWTVAGRPRCVAYGDALPAEMTSEESALAPDRLAERLTHPALDLRQGRYARTRRALSPLWRRVAAVALIGVAAHAAIAAADVIALDRIAARHDAAARALVLQAAPGAVLGDDLAASVADLLPANGAGPSAFLPLLSRAVTALGPLGQAAKLRSVAFDAAGGTMSLEIEAPDLAALQQAGGALSAGGLATQAGAASQEGGRAVGAFLVKAGA